MKRQHEEEMEELMAEYVAMNGGMNNVINAYRQTGYLTYGLMCFVCPTDTLYTANVAVKASCE